MKLKDFLIKKKIKKLDFAKLLGISRVTLDIYISHPERTPYINRLAIEYITIGEVTRNDWDINDNNNNS